MTRICFLKAGMTLLIVCAGVMGQSSPKKKLIIGTKEAAPFAIKMDDSTWSGITIDLWRQISRDLGIEYEIREYDLVGLIEDVKQNKIDAAVAALTITAEREKIFDFTHPFYTTGLSIAIQRKTSVGWLSIIKGFISADFLKIIALLMLVLLIAGLLAWFFERKKNPEEFGGKPWHGIASGFWWSAVTMTTVGYGDKSPKTAGGRIVALIWMFTALIIISSFTAAITTTLTVTQLETSLEGPHDLPDVTVGTVRGSTSALYLKNHHISFEKYDTPAKGLKALNEGKIEALVYDEPILKYLVNRFYKNRLLVLANTFETQYYGIGLPAASPLRELINQSLLNRLAEPGWQDILYRYLGE